MAREQAQKQNSRDDDISRRRYLRRSGAVGVGAVCATISIGERQHENTSALPENVLSIVGTSSVPSTYEVTVSDEIVPGRYADALSARGTRGVSAEDAVAEGVRSYRYSGEITDLRVGDGVAVFVNGARVDPTRFSR